MNSGPLVAGMNDGIPLSEDALARKQRNEEKRQNKLKKFEAKKAAMEQMQKRSTKKKPVDIKADNEGASESILLGEKKNVLSPFPASYSPKIVESYWYNWWEKCGFFNPDFTLKKNPNAEKFVLIIPPPNVTGSLHIGHALTCAIQDFIVRWHRMNGKATLFLPGSDHAGIATQSVVEKRLLKEEGLTRQDLGREEFIKRVFAWKEKYGGIIYKQFRLLGISSDWSRVRFTMDPGPCRATEEAFIRLFNKGDIYRSNRIVNWCPYLKTAISNIEIDNVAVKPMTERKVPGGGDKKYVFGILDTFSYNIKDSDEKISVSTTRLETMLGDVAIAVHPDDKRYKHLVGKTAVHPFVNREIKILADDSTDMSFGTGAVKLTPAHDHKDYEVHLKHNLDLINVFTDDGFIVDGICDKFSGIFRFDARISVREELKKLGLFVETQGYETMLPICSRSGDIIEPSIKPQWWQRCSVYAKQAVDALKNGDLKLIPNYAIVDWNSWLENIHDWCISRQLWWGHRIPAYFIDIEGKQCDESLNEFWVAASSMEEAEKLARAKYPNEKFTLRRDDDVCDTWFSSSLWPFSTMGWPENSEDMQRFYPNTMIETGWDILFFWIARMVMNGFALTEKLPFSTILCHSIVRDSHNRKMSKSLGNVIDPIDVINGITLEELHKKLEDGNLGKNEIELAKRLQKNDFPNGIFQCGADALRFTLLSYTYVCRSVRLDVLRVEGYRKWCNKIWNTVKFAHSVCTNPSKTNIDQIDLEKLTIQDKWILNKFSACVREIRQCFDKYDFMHLTECLYKFWTVQLSEVYIEAVKPMVDRETKKISANSAATNVVLRYVINESLKLLHPAMPFITEELYQRFNMIPEGSNSSIMIEEYPKPSPKFDKLEVGAFSAIIQSVSPIRSLAMQKEYKKFNVIYETSTQIKDKFTQEARSVLKSVVKGLEEVEFKDKISENASGAEKVVVSKELSFIIVPV